MTAPVVILAVDPADAPVASAPAPAPEALGLDLFVAALRGEVALSDHTACWAALRRAHPVIALDLVYDARRIATDLAQRTARRIDAALADACRAALAAARGALADPGEDAALPDAHAALAQVAALLDAALAFTSDGGR